MNYCGCTRLNSHPPTTDWIGFIIDSGARCPPKSKAQLTNCMLRLQVLCHDMHACMSRDRCEHVDARIIDVRRWERFFFVVNVGFIQYSRALLFVCLLVRFFLLSVQLTPNEHKRMNCYKRVSSKTMPRHETEKYKNQKNKIRACKKYTI